jgi:NAD(P)-dependent dehydrogenase (short-subunit alcohol dehydrogenase family)
VFLGCKHGIPALRRAGGGSVINTASFVARMGAATPQIAYTASKGAVLAMTRELAVIHARENIRVNALSPGPLKTELLMSFLNTEEKKKRRLGAPADGTLRRGARDRPGGAVARLRRILVRDRRRIPGRRRPDRGLRHAGIASVPPAAERPHQGDGALVLRRAHLQRLPRLRSSLRWASSRSSWLT